MVRLLALSALFAGLVAAQSPTTYHDDVIDATLNSWSMENMDIGLAFPPYAKDADASEFIGRLRCSTTNGRGTGWCGMTLGDSMANNLIVMAYPQDSSVLLSLRIVSGYKFPSVYTGNAKITALSSAIRDNDYEVVFRCENCTSWSQNGMSGSISTLQGYTGLGWALSSTSPTGGSCPDTMSFHQHSSAGVFTAQWNDDAINSDYWAWTGRTWATYETNCGTATSTTTAPTSTATGNNVPSETYDYIVVGGGAGGIPLADRLSESGKKVLLIEKGPASLGMWGGSMIPGWLEGSNLTRFDVPGLSNQIWADANGIACKDVSAMAGCILGGGTAINAGLWWKPNPVDWDYNFPDGWKADDMVDATDAVFGRIPGTTAPSQDGVVYLPQPRDLIAGALESKGWTQTDGLSQPTLKNQTWTHTPYMFSNGQRNGPMGTYLVSASERSNFKLWLETGVRRVVREGSKITGVEVEPFLPGGYSGTVKLSEGGRVVLSAGAFGSAKILMRSGIGPQDQLEVVKNSATDGSSMISQDQWINLPVGYNVQDHTGTDVVISHPDIHYYDFYAAYNNPVESDKEAYLGSRTGILTQSASNLGPIFFEEVTGSDGITRAIEWTCRVEASGGASNGNTMTCSQYIGRGSKSAGRMTINQDLDMAVTTSPYLTDPNDQPTIISDMQRVVDAISSIDGVTFIHPAPGQSVSDYVNSISATSSMRTINHWIGTNTMGTDDGRTGGKSVVDTNTKVYGTDNLFVVDASIIPGMITANPSSTIVIIAEQAAKRILAL